MMMVYCKHCWSGGAGGGGHIEEASFVAHDVFCNHSSRRMLQKFHNKTFWAPIKKNKGKKRQGRGRQGGEKMNI